MKPCKPVLGCLDISDVIECDFMEGIDKSTTNGYTGEGTVTVRTSKGDTLVFKVDGPNFRTFKRNVEPNTGPVFTHKRLARQLFFTDIRVQTFVKQMADTAEVDTNQYMRSMFTAWKRDEHGWRTESETRATAMLSAPYCVIDGLCMPDAVSNLVKS